MADTNLPSPSGEPIMPGNVGDATMMIDIEHELRRSYLGYAVSTLISRALPDVRDGFKPVQRRILYGMRGLGIGPGASRVKSARVVGEVMGKYHPHGDAAIYGTLVRLAQDFSLRYPLIDPQGNFGCFTGDTKIKMLDGTEKTFEELASLDPQDTFFVYSVDSKGNIVVGEGHNSRVTRHDARLVRVTLDSGAQIRCTPDHRFMLRDGTYKEAQFLTPSDSLMPGYFDAAPIKKGLNEYLRVKQPSTGRYEFVHHIADAYNAERGIAPAFNGPSSYYPKYDVSDEMVSAAHNYNHRIVSIEWLEETADVYDITVDEHHNFLLADGVFVHNSVDGDPPAAQRYTECRMTPLAIEMLEDIERQTVEFMPNYDQSENEPVVLPGKFPNFLCNGGEGIAVGMSTSMAPHNLREVVDATLYFLDHPDATPDDLMKFVLAPDFPTAGLILGTKGAKEAYRTGRGRVIMQAQLQIEPMDNGKNAIVVTELPYQVNKAKLIEHIAGLAKEKRVDGITAINDFSDKHGMRMVIELRRDVLPKRIVNFLLKHSALRQTFGIIMLALVNGQPKMLNLAQIINLHVTHRREVITRRTRFELGNAKRRAHILEGMQIALDFLDEIIRLIRAASSSDVARVEMVTRFGLTQIQAEAILNMQLRQIAQLERQKTEDEYRGLLREIARLEDILVTPARLTRMIKDELKGLRDKYGDDRRTRILPLEADQITEEDLIPEEKTLVTISRDGYIKRVPMDTYRTQKRGGKGVAAANLKDEDSLAHLFVATTTHMILFFTNRGRVYRLKAYEVPQTSRQARGQHINNFIGLEPGDQVTAILPMKNLMGAGYLFMATEYGEVKRTNLSEFANLRANGLNCFDLEEGDNLKWIKHTDGNQDALIVTRNGMSVRFAESDVPTRGRTAGGVRGIEMRDPATRKMVDRVVTMDVVAPDTQLQLLVISENGLGKRTDLSKYNRQGRGGRGVKTMEVTNRTGPVVAAAVVGEDDKLMVISEKGVTIQTTIREIKETQSRRTQGVNVMNVGTGDRVVTIERLVDADEVAQEAEAAPDKDLQDVVVEPSVSTETNGGTGTNGSGRSKK